MVGVWQRVTAFAATALSRGVRLAYHHHMGAYVETASDVDRLMQVTGPEVGLLHDTGHVTFGADAPTSSRSMLRASCMSIARTSARKSRKWRATAAGVFCRAVNGAFSTPGEGCVDFARIVGILRDADYQGWLVVEGEQDPVVAPAYRYADMAYRVLRALVDGKPDDEARAAAAAGRKGKTG